MYVSLSQDQLILCTYIFRLDEKNCNYDILHHLLSKTNGWLLRHNSSIDVHNAEQLNWQVF